MDGQVYERQNREIDIKKIWTERQKDFFTWL